MTRRVSRYLVGALVIAGVAAAAIYTRFDDTNVTAPARAAKHDDTERPKARGVPVEAARVFTDDVVVDIGAVGTLQPNEAAVIQPEIAGRILRFGFGEGAKVEKGDVLVELDRDILQAELARAQSDLRLATANFERANTLAKQGSTSLRVRDEARAALDAARANQDLAEARLRKATIRAPFSGVVGLRQLSVGEYVTAGTRIVALSDIDPIKVDFRVPEIFLTRMQADQPIVVTVDARPGETFEGRIYAIDPIVDENGRAIRLRAIIPNPERKLSPGLFARVRIIVDTRQRALLVPESAVFAEKEKKYVYQVVEGRAVLTEVEVGLRRPGQVEILSGLEAASAVITAGQQQIRDGSAVQVLKSAVEG